MSFDYEAAFLAAGSEANRPPEPEPWEPPEDLSAREVCELPLPEGEHVLGELLREGNRMVVGGRSGEGKTTFIMGMARAVGHGEKFLGWSGCGAKVLIFDLEQGLRTVQRRLMEANLDQSDMVRYYRIPDGLSLDSDTAQTMWIETLLERHQPRMVVIDPLYKAHRGDSNDERAMVDLMRRFDGWRERFGFSLVIPMHLRKMDPRAATVTMDDIFGSGGLTRGAEVVLGIRKMAAGKSTLYFWKDRDGDLLEFDKWNLDFTTTTGFERAADDTEAPIHVQIARAFLASGGAQMCMKDIQLATGKSDRTIRPALKAMMERGEITKLDELGARGAIFYALEHMPEDEADRYKQIAGEEWA